MSIAETVQNAASNVNEMLKAGVTKRALDRITPKLAELTKAYEALTNDLAKRFGIVRQPSAPAALPMAASV